MKSLLAVLVFFPLSLWANNQCYKHFPLDGYILHPSKMQDRKLGNIKDTLNYLFGRPTTELEIDKRSEIERLLDSRTFKTWFDFKNRSDDFFKRALGDRPGLIKHVENEQDGLLAKIMIARQAQYTIDATYYIFKDDSTGYALLDAFKGAIQRGVSVRFMVDSLGSINPKHPDHPEMKALVEFAEKNAGFMRDQQGNLTNQRARIEFVTFRSINPVQFLTTAARKTFRRLVNDVFHLIGSEDKVETVYLNPNRRSHDKFLGADMNFPELAIFITGGRNMSIDYYGMTPSPFMDFEVIARNDPKFVREQSRNTITTDWADFIDQLYYHSGNRRITAGIIRKLFGFEKYFKKMEEGSQVVAQTMSKRLEELNEDFNSPDFGKKYLNEGFDSGQVSLMHTFDNTLRDIIRHQQDPTKVTDAEKKNVNNITVVLPQRMAQEKKHIVIVSPYLMLTPEQITALKIWLSNDPTRKLTIISNSILTSDNMGAQIMVDAMIGPSLLLNPHVSIEVNGTAQTRSYDPSQVDFREYGKLDAVEIGGTVQYGKLHGKLVYLEGLNEVYEGTYNGDFRSQRLNSESGLYVRSVDFSKRVAAGIQTLIQNSHAWGSDEFHAIRKHEKLGDMKRKIAANNQKLYEMILKLKLAWLI